MNTTWFDGPAGLRALTRLDWDALWHAGFETDDLDFGFMCDTELLRPGTPDGDGMEPDDEVRDGLDAGAAFLAQSVLNSGKILMQVRFRDKFWYLFYHS